MDKELEIEIRKLFRDCPGWFSASYISKISGAPIMEVMAIQVEEWPLPDYGDT